MNISPEALRAIKEQLGRLSEKDIEKAIESKSSKKSGLTFEHFNKVCAEWMAGNTYIEAGFYLVAKKEFYHPLAFFDEDVQLFKVTRIISEPSNFTDVFSAMSEKMPSVYTTLKCDIELMLIDDDGEIVAISYSSKLMRLATNEEVANYKEFLDAKSKGEVCKGCGKVHKLSDHLSAEDLWKEMINIEDENEFIKQLTTGEFQTALMASTAAANSARRKFDSENDPLSEMALINRVISELDVEDRNQHILVIAGMLIDNYNRTVVLMNPETHSRYQRMINYFSKERKN